MIKIKFKAWHEGANKMFPAEELGRDELTINPDGRGFVNVCSIDPRLSEYYTNMIPLQYIGLDDANGNEIYEEDIIYNPDAFGCRTRWGDCEDNYPCRRVVLWDDKDLQFKLFYIEENIRDRGTSGFSLCKGNEHCFEVIGNVHEDL